MKNKNESKYFYTASLMDEALLSLLEEKEYEYITIKEVCKKAGVNRSTFYLHYENINDLLEECIESLHNKFIDKFKTIDAYNMVDEILLSPKYLLPYLTFVKENKKVFKLIHSKPHLFKVEETFNRMYKKIFILAMDKHIKEENEKEYIFSFFTSGAKSIVLRWVDNDCKDDIDFIINVIDKCINK